MASKWCWAERRAMRRLLYVFRMVGLFALAITVVPVIVYAEEQLIRKADRPQQVEPGADLATRVLRATALLYKQNLEGNMTMVCTATAFERDPKAESGQKVYYFAVASHCVASDNEARERVDLDNGNWFLTFDESANKNFLSGKVVAAGYQHRGDDFAVLKVMTDLEIQVIPLADSHARLGEDILNIASPGGFGKQLFTGHVSMAKLERPVKVADINWENSLLLQMPVGGGSSGSAIVSLEQRAIVGFLVGTVNAASSVVAIPTNRFKQFWESSRAGTYKWFKVEESSTVLQKTDTQ